jgi:hypothetical protein
VLFQTVTSPVRISTSSLLGVIPKVQVEPSRVASANAIRVPLPTTDLRGTTCSLKSAGSHGPVGTDTGGGAV